MWRARNAEGRTGIASKLRLRKRTLVTLASVSAIRRRAGGCGGTECEWQRGTLFHSTLPKALPVVVLFTKRRNQNVRAHPLFSNGPKRPVEGFGKG